MNKTYKILEILYLKTLSNQAASSAFFKFLGFGFVSWSNIFTKSCKSFVSRCSTIFQIVVGLKERNCIEQTKSDQIWTPCFLAVLKRFITSNLSKSVEALANTRNVKKVKVSQT